MIIQPLLHALVFILLILVMSRLISQFNEAYAARPRMYFPHHHIIMGEEGGGE